jgi:hypothetical protein
MQFISQLSGRIPIAQYVGPGNERDAAALREVLIDGVSVKTSRAATPTSKWQLTYHSEVIRSGSSYAPEYRNRALDGIVNVHKTKVQGAQQARLENLPTPWTPESNAVAVTGRFTRAGGDVDNVHLYHFLHRNTVNWMLVQAVAPLLPLSVVPDPDSWRFVQEMHVKLGGLVR